MAAVLGVVSPLAAVLGLHTQLLPHRLLLAPFAALPTAEAFTAGAGLRLACSPRACFAAAARLRPSLQGCLLPSCGSPLALPAGWCWTWTRRWCTPRSTATAAQVGRRRRLVAPSAAAAAAAPGPARAALAAPCRLRMHSPHCPLPPTPACTALAVPCRPPPRTVATLLVRRRTRPASLLLHP